MHVKVLYSNRTEQNNIYNRINLIKTLLIWEISDWLDGLSFFDGDTEFLNLDDYKNTFTSLNSIYKNPDKWTIYYAFTNEEYIRKLLKEPSDYGKPWFGQLMALPQLYSYILQTNMWLKEYKVKIKF